MCFSFSNYTYINTFYTHKLQLGPRKSFQHEIKKELHYNNSKLLIIKSTKNLF